jgi:hypothetical protein
MAGNITPLYVVCSPFRRVGKTLVARLLTEFHILRHQPVTAFDLADEGPQLADYLPYFTTLSDITKTRGQMALFDRIISDVESAKVIDLSHRMFNGFFSLTTKIGFFEEAQRHRIEPVVLFIVDVDPKSSAAYKMLRRTLVDAPIFPVRNKTEPRELTEDNCPAGTSITALQIPMLHFSLMAKVNQTGSSFSDLCALARDGHLDESDVDLLIWIEHVFGQIQQVQRLIGVERTSAEMSTTYYPHTRQVQQRNDIPEEVFKFVPEKHRRVPRMEIDQSGNAVIAMLQEAGGELRSAKVRIDQLEIEAQALEHRAARAEAWLQVIEEQIREKLIEPKLNK